MTQVVHVWNVTDPSSSYLFTRHCSISRHWATGVDVVASISFAETSRSSSLSPREKGSLSIGAGSRLFNGSHLLTVAGDGSLAGVTTAGSRALRAGRYKSSSEMFVGRSSNETFRAVLLPVERWNRSGFGFGRRGWGASIMINNFELDS